MWEVMIWSGMVYCGISKFLESGTVAHRIGGILDGKMRDEEAASE